MVGFSTPRRHPLQSNGITFTFTMLREADRLWRDNLPIVELAHKCELTVPQLNGLIARARHRYPKMFLRRVKPTTLDAWTEQLGMARTALENGASLHAACKASGLPEYVAQKFLRPLNERYLGQTPHSKVMEYLKANPDATYGDLAAHCGTYYATARLFCRREGIQVKLHPGRLTSKKSSKKATTPQQLAEPRTP